jgi:DNA-binding NtrC family response regulator
MATNPGGAGQASQRILVLHEAAAVVSLLRRNLTVAGYEVDATSDEREALRRLRKHTYALLIADVLTPGRLRLLEHRLETPLVVVSDRTPLGKLVDVTEAGAWDFIDTNEAPKEILGVVRRALAYGQLQRQLSALAQAGGVMNSGQYERVLHHVKALRADLQTEKTKLRARARTRHPASA